MLKLLETTEFSPKLNVVYRARVKNDPRSGAWSTWKAELPFTKMGKTCRKNRFKGEKSGFEVGSD